MKLNAILLYKGMSRSYSGFMLKNKDFHEITEAERVEQFPIWQELVNAMPKAQIHILKPSLV